MRLAGDAVTEQDLPSAPQPSFLLAPVQGSRGGQRHSWPVLSSTNANTDLPVSSRFPKTKEEPSAWTMAHLFWLVQASPLPTIRFLFQTLPKINPEGKLQGGRNWQETRGSPNFGGNISPSAGWEERPWCQGYFILEGLRELGQRHEPGLQGSESVDTSCSGITWVHYTWGNGPSLPPKVGAMVPGHSAPEAARLGTRG